MLNTENRAEIFIRIVFTLLWRTCTGVDLSLMVVTGVADVGWLFLFDFFLTQAWLMVCVFLPGSYRIQYAVCRQSKATKQHSYPHSLLNRLPALVFHAQNIFSYWSITVDGFEVWWYKTCLEQTSRTLPCSSALLETQTKSNLTKLFR